MTDFHTRYGISAHWPAPLQLSLDDHRALDQLPVAERCEEIARRAHDAFVSGFPSLGANAHYMPALEMNWRRRSQSYLTAAFASYMGAGE